MTTNTAQQLARYVDVLRPIIYLHSFDFSAVDKLITAISKGIAVYEYNAADGYVDFVSKTPKQSYRLGEFFEKFDFKAAN